jgi:hypothetical protein
MSLAVSCAQPSRFARLPDSDFDAISAALAASERGRRFLDEFLRRRRCEDVARLLAAVDRIEAHARNGEADRARRRIDAERAAEVVRQMEELLQDLRPLADARLRARALARGGEARPPKTATALERRFAALVELDDGALLETGLKLFG